MPRAERAAAEREARVQREAAERAAAERARIRTIEMMHPYPTMLCRLRVSGKRPRHRAGASPHSG